MNLIKIKIITPGFFKLKSLHSNNSFIYTRQGEFLVNNDEITDITKKYILLDVEDKAIKIDEQIKKIQVDKNKKTINLINSANISLEFKIGFYVFKNPMGLIENNTTINDQEVIRYTSSLYSSGVAEDFFTESLIEIGISNDMSSKFERIGFNWEKMKIKIQSTNAFLRVKCPISNEMFYTRVGDLYLNHKGFLCDIGGYIVTTDKQFEFSSGINDIIINQRGDISYTNHLNQNMLTDTKLSFFKFHNQLGLSDVSSVYTGKILAGTINKYDISGNLYFPTTISKGEETDQVLLKVSSSSGSQILINNNPCLINGEIIDRCDPDERYGANYFKLKFRPISDYLFRYRLNLENGETMKCFSSDGELYLSIVNGDFKFVNRCGLELDIPNKKLKNLVSAIQNKYDIVNQNEITINKFGEVFVENDKIFKLPMNKIRQEIKIENYENLSLKEYTIEIEPAKSGTTYELRLNQFNLTFNGPLSKEYKEIILKNITLAADINGDKIIKLYFDNKKWTKLSENMDIEVISNSQEIDTNCELINTEKLEKNLDRIKCMLEI